MPIIPPSLQQKRPTSKPLTISEKKLVKEYGSLENAQVQQQIQQQEQKNIEQKTQLQNRINEINRQIEQLETWQQALAGWDQDTRNQYQGRQQALAQERAILQEGLAGISKGGYYENIQEIQQQAKKSGSEKAYYFRTKYLNSKSRKQQRKKYLDIEAKKLGYKDYNQYLNKTQYEDSIKKRNYIEVIPGTDDYAQTFLANKNTSTFEGSSLYNALNINNQSSIFGKSQAEFEDTQKETIKIKQTGGTGTYNPDTGQFEETYIEQEATRTNLSDSAKDFINFGVTGLLGARDAAIDIVTAPAGGDRERISSKDSLFTLTPKIDNNTYQGTINYSDADYKYKGNLATLERNRIIDEAINKKIVADTLKKEFETLNKLAQQEFSKNYRTNMTQEEITALENKVIQRYELAAERKLEDIQGKYTQDFYGRERQRMGTYLKNELKVNIGTFARDVATVGSYLIPGVGPAFLAGDLYKAPKSIKEGINLYYDRPELRGKLFTRIGSGVAAGLLVGGTSAGIKRIKLNTKIKNAITESKINTKPIGKLTERQIIALDISNAEKTTLLAYLKEGKIIRSAEITNTAKSGLEQYTPKISGVVIEVVTMKGQIIQRIGVGAIKATLKNKSVDISVLTEAIGIIDKKLGTQMLSKIALAKTQYKFNPLSGKITANQKGAKELTFVEKLKLTERIIGKNKIKYKTETDINLVNAGKFYGKRVDKISRKLVERKSLLEDYGTKQFKTAGGATDEITIVPNFAKIKSVNIGKSKSSTTQLLTGKEINRFARDGKVAQVIDDTSLVFGKSEFTFQKPRFTFSKQMKDFNLGKDSKVITPKSSPPKSYTGGSNTATTITSSTFEKTIFNDFYSIPSIQYGMSYYSSSLIPSTTGISNLGLGIITGTQVGLLATPAVKTPEKYGLLSSNEYKNKSAFEFKPDNTQIIISPNITDKTLDRTLVSTKINTTLAQNNKLNTQQIQKPTITTNPTAVPVTTPITKTTPPLVPTFNFPDEKKEVIGYDAYAYQNATKKQKAKYIKLNKAPLTKKSALSVMARAVDTTISARGKIVKAKPQQEKETTNSFGMKIKQKPKVINTNDKYFETNRYKFRNWKQRKGKRTSSGNVYLERQRYRLDNPTETKSIQVAKKRKMSSLLTGR